VAQVNRSRRGGLAKSATAAASAATHARNFPVGRTYTPRHSNAALPNPLRETTFCPAPSSAPLLRGAQRTLASAASPIATARPPGAWPAWPSSRPRFWFGPASSRGRRRRAPPMAPVRTPVRPPPPPVRSAAPLRQWPGHRRSRGGRGRRHPRRRPGAERRRVPIGAWRRPWPASRQRRDSAQERPRLRRRPTSACRPI